MTEDNYNKELCEERHENVEKGFERAFKKIGDMGKILTRFYLLAISTLVAIIINILMTWASNGK